MQFATIAIMAALVASPALAQSSENPAREGVFYDNRCHNCHVIRDADGTLLAGVDMAHIAAKGPNLYGIMGMPAGTAEGYEYSELMIAARDAGLVWTEEEVVKFLDNPTRYLRAYTGLTRGNSMSSWVHDEPTRKELAAFIANFGPTN